MKAKKLVKKVVVGAVKPFPPARRKVRHVIWGHRSRIYHNIKTGISTEPRTIIFESFMGQSYSDNPKAIYEKALQDLDFSEYKFIWCFKSKELQTILDNFDAVEFGPLKDGRTELVAKGAPEYYRAYARAGVWISNSRLPEYLQPTKNQKYIQTWHGTPLKRLGYDIEVEGKNAMNSHREILEKYDIDAKRYSAMVSPSSFVTKCYKSAFNLKKNNPDCKIWEVGYPRNDRLANHKHNDTRKIRERFNIPKNKKVILYAPTWRDDQHKSGVGYTYQNELDFDKLRAALGDDYVILFRAHYFVANKFDFEKYGGFVINASKVSDINDLYIASDMLITDYSSVFFDYAILRRPIVFYMYDLDEYQDKMRGFYLPLTSLPGPVATTADDLIRHIKAPPKIGKAYEKFLSHFAPKEDGKAGERVVELIKGLNR